MDKYPARDARMKEKFRILPGTWLWNRKGRNGDVQTRRDFERAGRNVEHLVKVGLVVPVLGDPKQVSAPPRAQEPRPAPQDVPGDTAPLPRGEAPSLPVIPPPCSPEPDSHIPAPPRRKRRRRR